MVNTERSTLSATQNRLQMTISNLGNMYENMAAGNSRLKDVDVAEESAAFSRNQILSRCDIDAGSGKPASAVCAVLIG